ncbi:MAG: NAD(P)-binding domain-containing protein [Bacteroidales bacterium]
MKIAILGTGTMGSGMAQGMLNAGQEVVVYNRTKEKTAALVELGAKVVDTPEQAIEMSDAAIVVLADGAALRNVILDEKVKSVLNGKRILNASTTNYKEIEEIANEVALNGGSLAEISILCGSEQLITQNGSFLLGCKKEEEEWWKALLQNVGSDIFYVGNIANASKAESPMLFGSVFMNLLVAYSGAVAIKLNIPQQIISQQVAMMVPGAEYFIPSILARDFDQVMASVDSFKVVAETAITTLKSLEIPTKILEDALSIYNQAAIDGLGEKDGTSIVQVLLNASDKLS